MLTYNNVTKKISRRIQNPFCIFESFLSYLVYAKFQLSSSSVSKKNNIGVSSTPSHQLQGQNMSVVIALIELIKPSDAINYEPFLMHCFIQTILHILVLFIFVRNKIFCSKKILKIQCFWCSLCKVIGN